VRRRQPHRVDLVLLVELTGRQLVEQQLELVLQLVCRFLELFELLELLGRRWRLFELLELVVPEVASGAGRARSGS
jgi:hypothetical protein